MLTPVRFSSCRGVAFEMKDHFSISSQPIASSSSTADAATFCPPLRDSHKIFPSSPSNSLQRSLSKPSSHFCDIDPPPRQEDELYDHDLEEALQQHHDDDDDQKQTQIPQKQFKSRLSVILLDQGLFTVYKRLFILSLSLNLTALTLAATGHFPYATKNPALFSIANILASTLCRSEAFLRAVFALTVAIFGRSWIPLSLKTALTSFLQSLGGVHSGCGVSSIAWLLYALHARQNSSPAITAVASSILALLCLSSLAAFPLLRHLHHNVFERTHRFAGWTALTLLWAFVILTSTYDPITKSYNNKHLASSLLNKQEFWFTTAITFLILLPWLMVRRVAVQISAPSGHASIIKFNGGVKPGLLGRISPSPLSEWHAFGIISDGRKEHTMLAGAVGDFTRSLVSDPPSHLWVRGVHFAGLPYLVNMYERALVVATGSGICVFLSFLLQRSKAEVYLVWVAKGIEENFGKEVMEMVNGYPKEKVIVYDTAVSGRPNVAEMTLKAAGEWKVEVVIVTSNPEGSRDVVNACNSAGISAFGPIWDS